MRMVTGILLLSGFLTACDSSPAPKKEKVVIKVQIDTCQLSLPMGWKGENFSLPVPFAPEITYRGKEQICFCPGWGKKKDAQYWSYAFLWTLDGSPAVNSDSIAAYLTAYYNGLYRANTKGRPVNTRVSVTAAGSNLYHAAITTKDYLTLQPLVLNGKVCVRPGRGRLFIFHALSPQPYSHAVWKELADLWKQFECPS